MRTRTMVFSAALVAVLLAALPVSAAMDTAAALAYLKTQQNSDGGFGSGFSPDSALSSTADALLAIVAAGGEINNFQRGGKTPLTYLVANAAKASTAGDLAKLILALVSAGENPRTAGGVDSVAKLEALMAASGRIGGSGDTFISHLLAVLALCSASRPVPAAAVAYILQAQQEDGGWAWDGTSVTPPDTNTTAFALQALIAAGEPKSSQPIARALAYYKAIQNEDGGWPYQNPSDFGTATDANSTAVTIQALIAAGEDPAGAAWTTAAGQTPMAALERLQTKSGAFAWKADIPSDNLLATVQALPALAGKAFPFATMSVGEAAAMPTALPATGGAPVGLGALLSLGGLGLLGLGFALQRRGAA